MKRTGGWARKVALRTKTPLVGSTPMQRASRLTRSVIAAKRHKVSPQERQARRLLRARSGGICEGCGENRASDFSHRVNTSQGGQWCVTNGLHLCRSCHSWLHHNIVAARVLGWSLQRHENPQLELAVLAGRGACRLTTAGFVEPIERAA